MESAVDKRALLNVLAIAQSVADRKSTMPILANVCISAQGDDSLSIAATDLNLSVSACVPSTNADEWALTANAAHLHGVVARMPDVPIVLRRSSRELQIVAGHVAAATPAMQARDFPRIPDSTGLEFGEVDAGVLREMIDRTLFAAGSDPTRYHLNGVFFECDGETARMVATDGHRLSKVDRPLAGGPNLSAGIIVPKKGVQEIKKVIDSASKLSLAVKAPYLFVRGDAMTLAVKLIESQFPPYEQVIPKQCEIEMVVDGDALLAALWRARLLSSDNRGAQMRADENGIVLVARDADGGRISETISEHHDGLPCSFLFNARYGYEHVESMCPGDIVVSAIGECDPVKLVPAVDPSHIAVIMTMRA